MNILKRQARRLLLVEFNPYQILVAEISRTRQGSLLLAAAAEFTRRDSDGFRRWVEASGQGRKSQLVAICGLVPHRTLVQREQVEPSRLAEPGYLDEVAEEQQKGRFLTATPFKIQKPQEWTLRAVSAVAGTIIPPNGPVQPALICAVAKKEILDAQENLLANRVTPLRVEPGLLSLFGAVYGQMERKGGTHAVVVVVIHRSATAVYILGKEGVYTPNPVLHGLDSIVQGGRKELGEIEETEVLVQLQRGNPALVEQGAKLVRRIGRDLKPAVDSFEMTTGQPVDEVLCAYLPPSLHWIAEPLASSIGRTPLVVNCAEWLPAMGLEIAENGPQFGAHWVGALSLAANVPKLAELKPSGQSGDEFSKARPWHVDCSVPVASEGSKLAGRRFLLGAVAAMLAALGVIFTAWQLYATYSLKADMRYWEDQMAGNRKLFDELNSARAALKAKTGILDRAYAMMGESYQHSNLFLDLGRTLPARMRIDRIETDDRRVAISGSLLEPAEEASGTLGQHMADIRRHPTLGPLFANIAITSLQRKANGEAVVFELTLRFKRSSP